MDEVEVYSLDEHQDDLDVFSKQDFDTMRKKMLELEGLIPILISKINELEIKISALDNRVSLIENKY